MPCSSAGGSGNLCLIFCSFLTVGQKLHAAVGTVHAVQHGCPASRAAAVEEVATVRVTPLRSGAAAAAATAGRGGWANSQLDHCCPAHGGLHVSACCLPLPPRLPATWYLQGAQPVTTQARSYPYPSWPHQADPNTCPEQLRSVPLLLPLHPQVGLSAGCTSGSCLATSLARRSIASRRAGNACMMFAWGMHGSCRATHADVRACLAACCASNTAAAALLANCRCSAGRTEPLGCRQHLPSPLPPPPRLTPERPGCCAPIAARQPVERAQSGQPALGQPSS